MTFRVPPAVNLANEKTCRVFAIGELYTGDAFADMDVVLLNFQFAFLLKKKKSETGSLGYYENFKDTVCSK